MAEPDVLIEMSLDITKVESQVNTVKKLFKDLNDGSVFNNINRAIGTVTNNIRDMRTELSGLKSALQSVNGVKLDLTKAIDKVAKAQADMGTAAETAAAKTVAANEKVIASNKEVASSLRSVNAETTRPTFRERFGVNGGVNPMMPVSSTRQLQVMQERMRLMQQGSEGFQRIIGQYFQEADAATKKFNQDTKESIDLLNQRDRLMSNSARQFASQVNRAGGVKAFAQSNGLNVVDVQQAVKWAEEYGATVRAVPTYWERVINRFGMHLGQWALWGGSIGVALAGLEAIERTMTTIVSQSKEFQVQGVLFQASQKAANFVGDKTTAVPNGQLLSDSIKLATQYGDQVNTVAQDLQLWTKQTNDYNSALALTNETLKFHLATGTQLEDVYRTITALQSQASEIPFAAGEKKGFNLSDVPRLLQEITAESLVMGAGLHQITESGREMGNSLNNSAILYLKALEQDAAALASLHYSVEDSVALNAALIQAFGNTGNAAEEAGDKLQRIVGGLERISTSNGVAGLEKAGMSVKDVNKYLFSGGDILEKFAKDWDKLGSPMQKYISLAIGGTRQTDAFHTVLVAYTQDIQKARKALQDKGAEDELANQMAGTYEVQTQRLNAAWEGFAIIIGTAVMPALTGFIQWLTNSGIPAIEGFAGAVSDMFHNIAREAGRTMSSFGNGFTEMIPIFQQDLSQEMKDLHDPTKNRADVLARMAQTEKDLAAARNSLVQIKQANKEMDQDEARRNGDLLAISPSDAVNAQGFTRALWKKTGHNPKQWVASDPNAMVHHDRLSGNMTLTEWSVWSAFNARQNPNQVFDVAAALEKYKAIAKQIADSKDQAPPGSQKGMAKDFQDYADAVRNGSQALALYVDNERLAVIEDDAHIKRLQTKLKIEPQNLSLMRGIISLTQDRTKHLTLENVAIQQNIDALKGQISHAQAMANASPAGSTERDGWLRTADELTQKLIQQKNAFQQNIDAAREAGTTIQDSIQTMLSAFDKTLSVDYRNISHDKNLLGQRQDLSKLNNDLAAMEVVLRKILPEIKDPAVKDFINQWISDADIKRLDTTTSDLETMRAQIDGLKALGQDMSGKTFDALATMTGMPSYEVDYYKQITSIQKQYVDYQKQIDTYTKEFGETAVAPLLQMRDAWYQASVAAAQYTEHVKAVEDSALYKAATSAFDSMASAGAQGLTDYLFGNTKTQNDITGINSEIAKIQELKQQEDRWYQAQGHHTAEEKAAHDNRMAQYDAEIKKLQDKAAAEKASLQHPTLIKKVAEDFVKSVTESLLKSLAQSTLKKLFNIDENKELTNALRMQAQATMSGFDPAVNLYAQTTMTFGGIMQTWAKAVDVLDADVASLAQAINGAPAGVPGGKFTGASLAQFLANPGMGLNTGGSNSYNFSIPGIPSGSSSNLNFSVNGQSLPMHSVSQLFSGSGFSEAAGAAALIAAASGGGSALFGGGSSSLSSYIQAASSLATTRAGGSNLLASFASGNKYWTTGIKDVYSQFEPGNGKVPFSTLSMVKGHVTAGGILGALSAAYAGYEQGGLAGATEGGLGVGLDVLMMTGNPLLAAGAGLADFVGTLLFGNHDNPALMPDKYDTQTWGQDLANLVGNGYAQGVNPTWIANGQSFSENSQLAQQLGNQGELMFISNWIKQNPTEAAKILSPQQLADFTGLQNVTPNGGPIANGKNGNLTLSNGVTMNWQDMAAAADSATQAILNFQNATNSASQGLVSLNMFGASMGYMPYAWSVPGYDSTLPPGQAPPGYGGSGGGSTPGTPGAPVKRPPSGPVSGAGGGHLKGDALYAYAPVTPTAGSSGATLTATLVNNIDGREVSRSVQSYNLRAQAAGNNYVQ